LDISHPTAPILLFDSGVGGLSVLEAVRRELPGAPVVYAADNAGFPYGTKSEAQIATRIPALLGRLVERYRPRLVVIACNTASTIALEDVRAALDLAVVGTVPAIKPAAKLTETGVIGLLGTEATVRQAYVDALALDFANGCTLLRHGSAELVAAAEERLHGGTPDPAVFARVAKAFREQPGGDRMDVVVLACTHFPLVEDELRAAMGDVRFVHGADGIARQVARLLGGQTFERAGPDRLVLTASDTRFAALEPALARYGLEACETL
jgi:glutamate racemase